MIPHLACPLWDLGRALDSPKTIIHQKNVLAESDTQRSQWLWERTGSNYCIILPKNDGSHIFIDHHHANSMKTKVVNAHLNVRNWSSDFSPRAPWTIITTTNQPLNFFILFYKYPRTINRDSLLAACVFGER